MAAIQVPYRLIEVSPRLVTTTFEIADFASGDLDAWREMTAKRDMSNGPKRRIWS